MYSNPTGDNMMEHDGEERFFGRLCAFLTVKKLPLLGNETVSAYWLLQPYIFTNKS